MKGFGSDNHSGVHPQILSSLQTVNADHVPSYGTDAYTEQATTLFQNHFGAQADVHFVYNGTASNVLCLRAAVQPYEAFLCSETSHMFQDECGAPEFFAGKLIPLQTQNGKILLSEIEKYCVRKGDQHFAQPKLISITQPTELGTCYSLQEIKDIVALARKHGLYVHIDGARLANAIHYLKTSFKEMTTDLGVDLVSFGGTKNGLMFGEAVIILNPDLKKNFKYIRKQSAQLPSKTRFISGQFQAYFTDNLHAKIAEHSCTMANYLFEKLQSVSSVKITQAPQSNAVFAILPQKMIKPLREKFFFYVWNEHTFECRLMTSWDTTKKEIDDFIDLFHKLSV